MISAVLSLQTHQFFSFTALSSQPKPDRNYRLKETSHTHLTHSHYNPPNPSTASTQNLAPLALNKPRQHPAHPFLHANRPLPPPLAPSRQPSRLHLDKSSARVRAGIPDRDRPLPRGGSGLAERFIKNQLAERRAPARSPEKRLARARAPPGARGGRVFPGARPLAPGAGG